MNCLISIIIPVFNEEKLIAKCLQSIAQQNYPKEKYEILVVDNDSTDKTVQIAKSFGAEVISFKESHVIGAVRHYGTKKAKGEILAFVDADSIITQSWLASIEEIFYNTKVMAACGVGLPDTHSKRTKLLFEAYNQFSRLQQVAGVVLPWGFNFAVRKRAYEMIGGFNPSLKSGEDWELGLRLQRRFGRKSLVYSQKLKVYTSTRKQDSMAVLIPYLTTGAMNYMNMVFLKRAKAGGHSFIR